MPPGKFERMGLRHDFRVVWHMVLGKLVLLMGLASRLTFCLAEGLHMTNVAKQVGGLSIQ